jgi:hypothetical protein
MIQDSRWVELCASVWTATERHDLNGRSAIERWVP